MNISGILVPTFVASLRSVGTAFTLAMAGMYLQQRGFMAGEGKKTLALISQQISIPALLFTKIVYCNQDWSTEPCPSVMDSIKDVWVLAFWPLYVVGAGLLVGYAVARLTSTPPIHFRAVLVACGFPNCTGVPLTLLSVIHANFPASTELGAMDPTIFLSVFLILYPMLQWGLGGFLLTPDTVEEEKDAVSLGNTYGTIEGTSEVEKLDDREKADGHLNYFITHNVLNNTDIPPLYKYAHQGMQDTDASMYVSNSNLRGLDSQVILVEEDEDHNMILAMVSTPTRLLSGEQLSSVDEDSESLLSETSPLVTNTKKDILISDSNTHHIRQVTLRKGVAPKSYRMDKYATVVDTLGKVVSRCLQPPVIAALLGLIVASAPVLRGVLVDIVTRKNQAPLQWFYDGLYSLGQAAVPINMMILGSSLIPNKKKELVKEDADMQRLPKKSMIGIVIGKMVILPIIGVVSCCILKNYIWSIPEGKEIEKSLAPRYLFLINHEDLFHMNLSVFLFDTSYCTVTRH